MKRKIFGFFAMAAMLFATSCSDDAPALSATGDENTVVFSVGLENVANSRAISDGSGANTLVYQIFDANGNPLSAFQRTQEDNISFPYSLTLRLVKGQTYKIAFWAQNSECSAYNTDDLTAVSVDYAGLNNDETRDAFFSTETFTVSGQTLSSTLRRPFAQINLGATVDDYKAAISTGIDVTKSSVKIEGVPTTLNLVDGSVDGSTTVNYGFGNVVSSYTIADDVFTLNDPLTVNLKNETSGAVEATDFAHLSMSYILAPAEKTTLDKVTFTLQPVSGSNVIVEQGLANVPVQRNWRTNILGSFLTTEVTFKIIIDPEYYGDYNQENGEEFEGPEAIADGVEFYKDVFYISNLAGLQWFQGQMNLATNKANTLDAHIKKNGANKWIFTGQTVKLMSDIDLSSIAKWAPIGSGTNGFIFNGVFDGDNHIVSNIKVNVTGDVSAGFFAGLIGTIKNLTLNNVNVSGQWKAGAVSGDGMCGHFINCHVNGGTISSTPNSGKNNANNVGGITGYLSAESNADVQDCSVRNLTIRAYRDVAGVAGTVSGGAAFIKNTVVENVKIIADQTVDYIESGKAANAGEIYGRIVNGASVANITGNKVNNNSVIVLAPVDGTLTVGFDDITLLPSMKGTDDFTQTDITNNMSGEATKSASYGATAIDLDNMVVDGHNNTIVVTTSTGNYTSVINAKSGTVKNMNILGAVRALFIGNGVNGDIKFENITVDQTLYAFNSDAGNKEYGVYFTNCKLYGWTSFSNVHKEVVFNGCTFGKGTKPGWDYAYMRPYNDCSYENCDFEEGFEFDPTKGPKIVFKNCRYAGTTLTTENISMLLENGIACPENVTVE